MGIRISFCGLEEVNSLIQFLEQDWNKNHIFVRDRELFDWQHKGSDRYNFVLAKDGNAIVGVLGFIPTSQFSSQLTVNKQIWLAIWKVKNGAGRPGLGLMMLKFLKKELNFPDICSLGLSEEVIPIYQALGYKTGVLSHRAFFNQNLKKFFVGQPGKSYKVKVMSSGFNYKISKEVSMPSSFFHSSFQKDSEYLERRYINHPRYDYSILYIYFRGQLVSSVVYRMLSVGDVKVGRIVDCFGENILRAEFNDVVSRFVEKSRLEYVDIVSNLPGDAASGFIEASDEVLIPNYFEPFEKRNVTIDYSYLSSQPLNIFRGDSDQDRPSL